MATPNLSSVEQAPVTTSSQYIDTWSEYWMEFAVTASRKSKDPKCRVGAVLVREDVILSTGFNGLARDVFDDPSLLSDPGEKLRVICHAEQNAIHNAARNGIALKGATIYVTKFPCLACCNAIVQAGVVAVHTHDTKFWDDDPADSDHSRKKSILRQARVKVEAPFHPDYAPKLVSGKATPIANDARPTLVEVPHTASKPRRKGERKKAEKPRNQGTLFPARRPIDGGRSGT